MSRENLTRFHVSFLTSVPSIEDYLQFGELTLSHDGIRDDRRGL